MEAIQFLSRYRVAISFLVVAAIGLILVVQLDVISFNSKGHGAELPDPTFEMIDPENPTTTVDNIFRLKKDFEKNKTEKCIIAQLKVNIEDKISSIGKPRELPVRSLTEFITAMEPYAAPEVFDFDWDGNFEACGKLSNDSYSLIQKGMYTASIYRSASSSYHNLIGNLLQASGIDPRYTRFIYNRNLGIIDADYFDTYLIKKPAEDSSAKLDANTLEQCKHIVTNAPELVKTRLSILNGLLVKREVALDSVMKLQFKKYNEQTEKYSKSRLDINDKAIKYGIFAFCFTALIMYLAALFAKANARQTQDGKDNFSHSVQEDTKLSMWYSVYMITVLLLIITIFILGLARLLTENSLAALLGGIAGYVLNNRLGDNIAKSNGITATTTSQKSGAAPEGTPVAPADPSS